MNTENSLNQKMRSKKIRLYRVLAVWVLFSIFSGFALFSAYAVSVDDMISLKNNGVDEGLIIKGFMEQAVKQVLTIDDMVKLKNAGFSGDSINRIAGAQSGSTISEPSISTGSVIVQTPASKPVNTYENVYSNRNVIVMDSRFSRKYGCLEIKNSEKWPILVDIDYQNRRITVRKHRGRFYSGTSAFIKSYSSTIFRVPSGDYLIEIPEEGNSYYMNITTAGAELILKNRYYNKKNFFSILIRVLGKKLFVPVKKYDKHKKHGKGNHKSRRYNSKYNSKHDSKYDYYHWNH
jgi:hypothetical protein